MKRRKTKIYYGNFNLIHEQSKQNHEKKKATQADTPTQRSLNQLKFLTRYPNFSVILQQRIESLVE